MPESVPDFTTFIDRLQEEQVAFVLIGGLAMIAHGSSRVTYDLDVTFLRSRENLGALVRALAPLKPRPRGFPEELPFIWDEQTLRSMSVATLRTTAGDLDLLAEPEGVDSFAGLSERSVAMEILGRKIRVASLDDLEKMKIAAGREKDRLDLATIQQLRRLRSDEAL